MSSPNPRTIPAKSSFLLFFLFNCLKDSRFSRKINFIFHARFHFLKTSSLPIFCVVFVLFIRIPFFKSIPPSSWWKNKRQNVIVEFRVKKMWFQRDARKKCKRQKILIVFLSLTQLIFLSWFLPRLANKLQTFLPSEIFFNFYFSTGLAF